MHIEETVTHYLEKHPGASAKKFMKFYALKPNSKYYAITADTSIYRNLLSFHLERKRKALYKKASFFGYAQPFVVACSQELDVLISSYNKNAS